MNNPAAPQSTDESRRALINRVARRVREVRKQKGMPRRVVSELSGVSPRYLAQLEAGEGNISIALLERVARALEMPIEALVAQQISVDSDAQRVAHLFERAPKDVRETIKALLRTVKPVCPRKGRVCLIGLRGAGKTTLGQRTAGVLNLPFIELSGMVEIETGMSLAEILSLYGADGYRRLEAEAFAKVIKQDGPFVLSVSGGLVEQEALFAQLLAQFHTIWLRTSPAEHVARVRAQGELQAVQNETLSVVEIKSLMDERMPLYARAEAQLNTAKRSAQQSVHELVALITQKQFVDA